MWRRNIVLKNYRIKLLFFALALALAVTGLLFYYFRIKSLENDPRVKVLVAVSNIKENAVIKNTEIREITVPEKYAITGAAAGKKNVIGKIAKENIYAGEQILQMDLIKGEKQEGLSVVIPDGFRAVTISTDRVSGVGGHIKDEDYVDVLIFVKQPYSNEKVKTIFQNVRVIDSGSSEKQSTDNKFITLCMSPSDAEKLFLVDETSNIRLSLRNKIDRKTEKLTETSTEVLK